MQFYHDWLHFFPTALSPRGEKKLYVAGFKRGELAPQVDAQSITPRLIGPKKRFNNISSQTVFQDFNCPFICQVSFRVQTDAFEADRSLNFVVLQSFGVAIETQLFSREVKQRFEVRMVPLRPEAGAPELIRWAIPGLFFLFFLAFLFNSQLVDKTLPALGFKPWISGGRRDRSTN